MLSDKRARFVQEYLQDFNATQAAVRAGYSPKTAMAQGSRLLKYAEVQEAIEAGKTKIADLAEITAEEITREFARIATFDVGMLFDEKGRLRPIHTLPLEQRRAVAAFEVVRGRKGKPGTIKVRMHDKVTALTQLGRIRGMFLDRIEQVGPKPITLLMVDRTPKVIEGEGSANG